MTDSSPAENYTRKLQIRLESLYAEYMRELAVIEIGLADSTAEVLEIFINIEQHRFQQISSAERVLRTHLAGCSPVFSSSVSEVLTPLRLKALERNRIVRTALKGRMVRIGTELSSIRVPGRAKNYRQESVPVLIDIER